MVWALAVCCLLSASAAAQPGLGVQAPLALVGHLQLGPLQLEAGLPLRFDLDSLAAFANVKFQWDAWSVEEVFIHPYIGGGAKLFLSELDAVWLQALIGAQVGVEDKPLSVYGQLGIAPGFPTGLLESLALGVRFRF